MKFSFAIVFLFFSTEVLSESLEGLVSAFVHLRCSEDKQNALLVLENNSPYTLVVKANKQINRKSVHPNIFSIFDADRLNNYKSGKGTSKDIIVDTLHDNFPKFKSESFELLPFEKVSWFLGDFLSYYQLNKERNYLLKVSGLGLDVLFDNGDSEYVVVSSNYHLVQRSCYKHFTGYE